MSNADESGQTSEPTPELARFSAEWDRQFALLSPEEKQAIVANPMGFAAQQLNSKVESAIERDSAK